MRRNVSSFYYKYLNCHVILECSFCSESSDSSIAEAKQSNPEPTKAKKKPIDKENKAPTKKTSPVAKKTKTVKEKKKSLPKEIKLFEISNMNSCSESSQSDELNSKSQNTCTDIMKQMENIQIEQAEPENTRPKRTLRTTTARAAVPIKEIKPKRN